MNGDTASILMIIGLIIFGIATIYFSTSKKAVVFWDGKDLILTTLAWLIVPLTTMAFREGNVFSIIAFTTVQNSLATKAKPCHLS